MDPQKQPLFSYTSSDSESNDSHDFAFSHSRKSSLQLRRALPRSRFLFAALIALICCCFGAGYFAGSLNTSTLSVPGHHRVSQSSPSATALKKPHDFKIIGMVFYGRPKFVSILDCYLQKNLAVNGGYLDEIHFMAHTTNEADLAWLDGLVSTVREYSIVTVNETSKTYLNLWEHATDPDTMYIKIDDDIMWIDDDAIPRLVHSLIDHPEAYMMASNLINSPYMGVQHFHNGAVLPYLPDLTHKPSSWLSRDEAKSTGNNSVNHQVSWRASQLPMVTTDTRKKEFDFDLRPPYKGHRWVPMERTNSNLGKTPIANISAGTGDDLLYFVHSWQIAAQMHYSLLDHLEQKIDRGDKDALGVYWAAGVDGIFNPWYAHYNINFMAIWGHSILEMPFFNWWMDDEWAMSEIIPKQLEKPLLVDTHALVSHYAFHTQGEGLDMTDVLDRYASFADEVVCRGPRRSVHGDR